jgi:tetratricopeptide (TPR) repeat protein
MKCPKCNQQNPDDSSFCSQCGTQILTAEKPSIPGTKTMHMPITELVVGSMFAGRYQVLEEIGRGGMGKVYKVLDKEINEKIALKLLHPLISADETMIERFRNELKTARKISHKHVCRMYHIGEEGGNYYITMEYVAGEDLKNTIRRVGQLSVGKAISIAKQAYEGLAEAHKLGIVHRDLKPQNIMIDREGNVRIMDFGIARFQEAEGLTDTGTMIGTPEYMSPEQVEGKQIDLRSDIYSSGVILYEMLTGTAPFTGDTPLSVAVKHKTEMPKEPKKFNVQIPLELNEVILKCLEKKKERRYQSTEDILKKLFKVEKEIPTKEMILEGKASPLWLFWRKLKERKIIETIAAFVGGGVALVEFAHHILVNHYHFPKSTVDIIIAALIFGMVTTVSWRWFREKEVRRRRIGIMRRIKLKWIAAFIFIGLIAFAGYTLLWRGKKQTLIGEAGYRDIISLNILTHELEDIPENLIEFIFYRSLISSTERFILVQEDFTTYKKRTESVDETPKEPLIQITGDIYPDKVTGGFDVDIRIRNRERSLPLKRFECKGIYDLMNNRIGEIHSYISVESDGEIGKIEGERTFAQISTDNYDALQSFLKGEEAWNKFDRNKAKDYYNLAVEYDPKFSLAYLKLAEAQDFGGGFRDQAKDSLKKARQNEDRLIEYDKLKLRALEARLYFRQSDYRKYAAQLAEEFPFKKECHYEHAEAYFRTGGPGEAIKIYTKALDIDPYYAAAHNHIAFCYAWLGDHKRAEEHFIKYVQLDDKANSYDSMAAGYMFAGEYDKAIEACEKGLELDSTLDYLYSRQANNYILEGALKAAAQKLKERFNATESPETQSSIKCNEAIIEFFRGDLEKSIQIVEPVIIHFSGEEYMDRVDESPNLPFWLRGLIAFKQNDSNKLAEMIEWMDKRLARHKAETGSEVTATKYFRIYKLYIHLKILNAQLNNKTSEVMESVREVRKIKEKMGFWASIFNVPFFYNEYAKIYIQNKEFSLASGLLEEAVEYNPNYAPARLNMARIHLMNDNPKDARKEFKKAQELLSAADQDYIFVKEAEELGKQLISLGGTNNLLFGIFRILSLT